MENMAQWLKPELVWFVVGLVLLLMEFALPGFVIFFFGVGAWIVSALCFATDLSLNTQLLTFIISSVFLLAILRNRLKPIFYGFGSSNADMSSDMEEFVGETGIVKEDIRGKIKGRVELHGTNWDAVAEDDIPAGTMVEITGKDNLTLKVRKV